MTNFELRKQAIDREEERTLRMDAIFAALPKRKSVEINLLTKLVEQAHKTLCHYDTQEAPPPVAGITETWFDTAIEQLSQITKAE